MRIHHIGYLVRNVEKSIAAFEALGYVMGKPPVWDDGRLARICFLENDGYRIELIEPARESSLFPMLKQYAHAPYHMCYCCDQLESAIELLKAEKYMLFLPPAPAPAIGENARVAFLMSA